MNVDDSVMTTQRSVTVLGLGLMGRALAGAFLRAGHPTTVWNRTASAADPLVAAGATRAASPTEAVAASPLVVVCVSTYDVVDELLAPLDLSGRVVVNLTSGPSDQARATAARLGGAYLDGAIMATPPDIGTPGAALLYSGPRTAFDEHEETLRVLGGATAHLGADHGLAALYDVALLGVMWNILNGVLQGAALVEAAGAGTTEFAAFAQALTRSVADWVPPMAREITEGVYSADDSTMDTHRAAMVHLVHESESLGVSTDLPRSLLALGDRAVADGRGGEGYTALIEYFRKPSGV
jgi:3-hydroxyisobutyrate dehydrogenase-like beta-hydroxyacid dehydrogenase